MLYDSVGDCCNNFFVFVSDRSRSGLAENLGQIPINKNCLFLPFLFFFMDSSTSTKPVPLFFSATYFGGVGGAAELWQISQHHGHDIICAAEVEH